MSAHQRDKTVTAARLHTAFGRNSCTHRKPAEGWHSSQISNIPVHSRELYPLYRTGRG